MQQLRDHQKAAIEHIKATVGATVILEIESRHSNQRIDDDEDKPTRCMCGAPIQPDGEIPCGH